MERPYNVLFLCTHNSARSVMAEAIMNKIGAGKFVAYSAGSQPRGAINPNTLKLLKGLGYDTSDFRSKSWDEFAKPARRKSISSSRFATTRRARSARCGPASRSPRTGE